MKQLSEVNRKMYRRDVAPLFRTIFHLTNSLSHQTSIIRWIVDFGDHNPCYAQLKYELDAWHRKINRN